MDLSRVGRMPPAANTVLIAVNPNAGKGSRRHLTDQLASRLTEQGFQVRFVQELEELTERSHRLQSEGKLRAVVAAGGDGTAATLVNRIPPTAPMAILPLGTENLLAKYLDQIISPEHLSKIIHQGLVVHLDAGLAGDRVFLLMAGCGFDADVVRRMHQGRSGNITHFDYAKPLLASLRHYPFPRLQIDYEAGNRSGTHEQKTIQARWAFIVNLPRYCQRAEICSASCGNRRTTRRLHVSKGQLVARTSLLERCPHGKTCKLARLPDRAYPAVTSGCRSTIQRRDPFSVGRRSRRGVASRHPGPTRPSPPASIRTLGRGTRIPSQPGVTNFVRIVRDPKVNILK